METKPKHVLAVDDDAQIRHLLDEYLAEAGFHITTVADGAAARTVVASSSVDMILLDILLPDVDGITLAKEFCATTDIPLLMLTVKGEEIERIIGLELGADDYITKPFSPRELVARMKAVFRRTEAALSSHNGGAWGTTTFLFADWELNPTTRRLTRSDKQERRLTASEFSLLTTFIQRPRQVLTREQLLTFSRANPDAVYDRAIDYLILRLRRKLEENPHRPRLIKTEHGVGYMFAADVTNRRFT